MTPEELTKARFLAGEARGKLTQAFNEAAELQRREPERIPLSLRDLIGEARETIIALCRLLNGQTATDTGLRGKGPVPYRTAP